MGLMCISLPKKQWLSPFPSPAQLSSPHSPARFLLSQPGLTLLTCAPPSPAQLNSHLRTAQPATRDPQSWPIMAWEVALSDMMELARAATSDPVAHMPGPASCGQRNGGGGGGGS